MKKTDIGVVGFMYAVCILFFAMTKQQKEAAQIYPTFIIVLLFLLTTGYLIEMLIGARKSGVTSGIQEIFEGFMPKQFFVVLAMIIGYLVVMYIAGFYISTILLMVACLLFLKVPKWQVVLTTLVILGLVYGAFTMFLGVRLPAGLLFK